MYVTKSAQLTPTLSKRAGLVERRLLTADLSQQQNIVLVETETGAEVELHKVRTSESIFVLAGRYVVWDDQHDQQRIELDPGDLCYFPPDTAHGMKCISGPGSYLAIFAPTTHGRQN